jgi:hypothetical protein
VSQRPSYRISRGEGVDPSYDRVARALSDDELEDEILAGRGEAGFKLALLAEFERRAQTYGKEEQ